MELPKPPQKGHSRAPSNETSRKLVTSPRRRTLGPLDLGDIPTASLGSPLIQSPQEPSTTVVSHPLQTPPTSNTPQNPPAQPPPTLTAPLQSTDIPSSPPPQRSTSPYPPLPPREFPNLLHPHLFHPLPNHDLPLPFRQPTNTPHPTPSPDTPLPTLLSQGYFRAAAITCATILPTLSPSNHQQIFTLWYIRLSCLCLIGATQTACIEVKSLEDLSAPVYWVEIPPPTSAGRNARPQKRHLVPWELRLLAIRLQALSFSDWRRALVFYYELAREARAELSAAINHPDRLSPEIQARIKLWKMRLSDLSIRIASALVEMGDLAAAARHLESLRKRPVQEARAKDAETEADKEDAKVRFMLCLLYIRIGNFSAAKESLPPQPPAPSSSSSSLTQPPAPAPAPAPTPTPTTTYTDHLIHSLLPTAHGSWEASVTAWSTPPPATPNHPNSNVLHRTNLAVSLVYLGLLAQARDILEDLIEEGNAFFALTFNLCTVWELVTDGEVTRERKREVAERVVRGGGRREAGSGWFKM